MLEEENLKGFKGMIGAMEEKLNAMYEDDCNDLEGILKKIDAYILKAKYLVKTFQLLEAESVISTTIKLIEKHFKGLEPEQYAASFLVLGEIHMERKDYEKSLNNFSKALAVCINRSGDNSIGVGNCYLKIAQLLSVEQDYDLADSYVGKAKEIFCKSRRFGIDLRAWIIDCCELQGVIWLGRNNLNHALEKYNEGLNICSERFGRNHPRYADILLRIAFVNILGERRNVAEDQIALALEAYQENHGIYHPKTAVCYKYRALLLATTSRFKAAWEYLEKALDIESLMLGKEHLSYLESLQISGHIARMMKDFNKAYRIYSELQESYSQNPKLVTKALACCVQLADLNYQQKNYEKAQMHITEAAKISEKLKPTFESHLSKMHLVMGRLHVLKDNIKEAKKCFQKRIEIAKKLYQSTKEYADDLVSIGDSYRCHRLLMESSLKCYNEAMDTYKKVLGATHHKTTELQKKIHKLKDKYIKSLILI